VSPLYDAVREWLPTARVEVTKVELPLLSVVVPMVTPPSLKVTVPAAVEGTTVAVRVTSCPKEAGFGETNRLDVLTFFTISVTGGDVLVLLLASPL
jgi:hypothetical protein